MTGEYIDPQAANRPMPSGAPGEAQADRAIRHAQIGDSLFQQAQFAKAKEHFEESLRLDPENPRVQWLLGMTHWNLNDSDRSAPYLMEAIRLDPSLYPAHASLSQWYLLHGKIEPALESSARAMALAPNCDDVLRMRAWVLEAAGEMDEAWALVQRLVEHRHAPQFIAPLYARMARYRGEQQKALEQLDIALAVRGTSANLRCELHLAAADMLDSLGRYDEAFAHVQLGNALVNPPYDLGATQLFFDSMIRYYSRRRIANLRKATHHNDKPIFIVGMPRSGTSLVEQILASHPQIHGAGELNFMLQTCLAAIGMLRSPTAEFPQCLDRLSISELDGLAQMYLQPLLALRPDATRITDKMPLNFVYLGLISMLLPEARIIHCRRNPLDTCLSCHMVALSPGTEFKFDLANLGGFHRQYQRLMAHWKSVLPLAILDVDYEKLVMEPEEQSRRLIEFAGVSWNDRCLSFHKTRRPVATGSVQQVRRPMYHSSINRWQHYDKHLGPLKAALGLK